MELLEREEFLQELAGSLSGVSAGQGCVVLVGGEAGIGKTSLVERFIADQRDAARVLWGACDALFTPRPLGPLYDIAQQAHGDLLSLLEAEAPRAAIFSAFLDALPARSLPSIVVIEDAHWADEATLDLLKFVGRRIHRFPSMLLVTYRDDEVGLDHPLRFVLGDLPHKTAKRLHLPPLSEAAVAALAEREGLQGDALYAATSGNPFFVTEVLANEGQSVPVTVRDAVLSRAARLSPASREVLELVSVIPARTEAWLLDEAMRPDPVALEECVGAGMLRHEGETIAFRHELARRAVEDSMSVPRRRSLHNLVLKALLERDSEALLARVVHHAAQAGDRQAVLEYAPVAARQAAALNAHREAASHYQTALGYADTLAPEERAELFEHRSYECYLTDQIEEALETRREALKIWKQAGDKHRQGDNLRWMSRLSWFAGRKKDAEGYGVEAVTILEGLPPGPELAMAYSNRAQLYMLADETEQAVLWGSRAIELAERRGATDTLAHALNNVGTAEWLANNAQGRAKLEESLRLSLRDNLQEHAARAYTNLASNAVKHRQYPLAMHYLEDGIAYTTEHDLNSWTLYMTTWRARAHFEQGDWDRAAHDADFVLGRYRVSAITKTTALAALGHVRVRRGDPDTARLLDEARELAILTGEIQRIAPVASARIEAAWLQGAGEWVLSEARSILEIAKGHRDPWLRGEFAFWLWRAGGTPEIDENIAAPYALQMRGEWRAAAEKWRDIGCPYEEAMALADGDEPSRREALEIYERLGAAPAAERLRQALRAAGVRRMPRGPRPSTKENPAGLTNRQMDVLNLLADGLSNADIAARLFVSPKTVDHHVSAILAKLDAHSRAEAVAHAVQSGILNQK